MTFRFARRAGLALMIAASFASIAMAVTVEKAATGTDLTDGASWTGGVAPGANDQANFVIGSNTGNFTLGPTGATSVDYDRLWFGISPVPAIVGDAGPITIGSLSDTATITLSSNSTSSSTNWQIRNFSTSNVTINNAITVTGVATTTVPGTGSPTFPANRSLSVSVDSTGSLTLANSITSLGTAASNDGMVVLRGSGAGGGFVSGVITVDGPLARVDNGSWTLTNNNNIGGDIITQGSGTLTLSGSNTIGGGIYNQAAGTIALTGINTIGGGIFNQAAGTIALTGINTIAGPIVINAGTLRVNTIKNLGVASALGAPATASEGTIKLGNLTTAGLLVYTGTGDETDRIIDLAGTTGGATLTQSGTGLLKYTSNLSVSGGGAKTLILNGSTAGSGEFAGQIVDGFTSTALSKNGTGSWTLSGNNSYSGQTTISGGGVLFVTSGSSLGTGTLRMDTNGILASSDATPRTFNNPAIDFAASATFGTATTGNLTLSGSVNLGGLTKTMTIANAVTELTGNIMGTGASVVTKAGSGTLILSGTFSIPRPINVAAGKLLINSDASAATGAVNVSALATIGGIGTIGGTTTLAGTANIAPGNITPGNTVGNLTLANGADLSAGGVYNWELAALSTDGTTPGLNFDLITVSGGNLVLGGTSALTLDFGLLAATGPNSADPFWTSAKTWKIIDVSGAGTNTGDTNLSTITNLQYTNGYFSTTVGSGDDAGDIFLVYSLGVAGPPTWQGADNDPWTAAASWSGSVPNSASAEAKFVTTGGTTANLDANQTVNKLTFDATAPHTISGASTLTLAGTTPMISTAGTNTATQTVAVNLDLAAGTAINVQGGTLELNSPANATLGTGVTATVSSGATLSLGGTGNALSNGASTHANVANSGTLLATTPGKRVGNIDGTGTTTVTAANATLTANHVRQATLNIGAGNTVTIANNGTDTGTSVVTSLNINATGKLDLDNNDLIVPNGNLTTLTAQLATGLDINGNYGNGPGITSSAFANNMDFNTVLGIAANSDLGYTSFSGQTVGINDVLIKYTYYGDADLSGSVDTSTDFDLYITGLTSGGSLGGWLFGDFDYSGTVDSSTDFDLYITGLTSQGSPLLTAEDSHLVQAVPEPSTFALVGAAFGLSVIHMARRKRGAFFSCR